MIIHNNASNKTATAAANNRSNSYRNNDDIHCYGNIIDDKFINKYTNQISYPNNNKN